MPARARCGQTLQATRKFPISTHSILSHVHTYHRLDVIYFSVSLPVDY